MEYYKVTLNNKEYGLPIVEIKPGLSIAVLDMLSSKELSHDASYAVLNKLKESGLDLSGVDVVLSAETKGITLAYQVAEAIGCEMVILRKEQKIYYKDVTKAAVDTYTTKDTHYLHLDNGQIPKMKGKNVLIVDDVVSTGSSLAAIEAIINEVGGNICGKAFVFAEGDAAKRDDIIFVDALPLL